MNYMMDNEDEILRLDLKTDLDVLKQQVLWAGLKPEMKVADLGCGPGKTTCFLRKLSSHVTGFDFSPERIKYAAENYSGEGIEYQIRDIREPFNEKGSYDFVFLRFILEFYKKKAFSIVENISNLLKPGGVLLIADLDHNCLNHFGLQDQLNNAIKGVIETLGESSGFDPYAGRKLYSYLYDLKFQNIEVDVRPHHLIYGDLEEKDAYNWKKKIEVAAKKSDYDFSGFEGGFKGFEEATLEFFLNKRRFSYTPIILCKGVKPNGKY